MSDTDGSQFLSDIEATPQRLREVADVVEAGQLVWPAIGARLVLTGMGSSWFAAQVAASRLRRAGMVAVAELSSSAGGWPAAPDTTVVGISASGGSSETLGFVAGHPGFVALTNTPGSRITDDAGHVVLMHAGTEVSGVACRSFRHTLVALLALEEQLTGVDLQLVERVRRAADATDALLADRRWLDRVSDVLDGPHGVYAIAPVERISSALQSALMVREGPRRPADGCETGDWSHVDVYLTKTLQYKALLFAGGAHEAAARTWMVARDTDIVSVGAGASDDAANVRFPGDDDPIVAMLTEVAVAELVADRWWTAARQRD
jgi:glucosamine--fructose-6-phosphate aminotransferase (isomerizing)